MFIYLLTLLNIGMRFSLPSRDLIADSIESATCGQMHDGNISIPGCDKNMPGCIMAMARHNRPSLMIYGGTIMAGHTKRGPQPGKEINISSCFEILGAYHYGAASKEQLDGMQQSECRIWMIAEILCYRCCSERLSWIWRYLGTTSYVSLITC